MKIEIANPFPGGSRFTSAKQAQEYCRAGAAFIANDGKLHFRNAHQRQILREAESEFRENRGGILYWNGARAHYVDGKDVAMFTPGCNVAFPKVGTARAARRFASKSKRKLA